MTDSEYLANFDSVAVRQAMRDCAAIFDKDEGVQAVRIMMEELSNASHRRSPGTTTTHVYASDCPVCLASHLLRHWPHSPAVDAVPAGEVDCNVCGGDCAGANPPVMNCPMSAALSHGEGHV